MIQDQECENVREFHQKFGFIEHRSPGPISKRLALDRVACMAEEVKEFADAAEAGDFAKMADALVDLVYFAKGTAIQMGLPWAALWADVQRANMAKVRGVGKRGQIEDVIKPPGWLEPQTDIILAAHGFIPTLWEDESTHRDYPKYKL